MNKARTLLFSFRELWRNCGAALIVICLILMLCFWIPVRGQETQSVETIRIDTNLISVPVIVSDRLNHYVPGLSAQNFQLFDNSVAQKISFFDAAEAPLNIVLLLDTSRSTEGVLDEIRKAAKNFLKELRPQDRAMILSFDYDIHRLSPLTNDRKILEQAIKHAEVGKYFGTLLNDAVMQASAEVLQPITGRKAIILLTDGKDAGSGIRNAELVSSVSEADAMIYSIYYESSVRGFGGRRPDFPGRRLGFPGGRRRRRFNHAIVPRPGAGQRRERKEERSLEAQEFLTKLSDVTGGRFYRSKKTDLKKAFAEVAEELRFQYQLGFYPADVLQDGSLHSLKVKVDRPGLAIRSRYQYRTKQAR